MLLQLSGCPVYEFTPRITFGNGVMPAAMYGLKVPPGLPETSVPSPNFIDPTAMVSMLKAAPGGHGRGIGVVHGLTVTDFSVSFSDPAHQWRQVASGAFPRWQFQGGDIYFDARINVYVLEGDRPKPNDDLTRQIFALIMEHELLHVLDEVDIMTRWIVPEATKDPDVLKYLSNAEPIDNSFYESWFKGTGFSDAMRDGLWAPEHNRRGGLRDAAHKYAALQDQIDDLRIKITNRPSP